MATRRKQRPPEQVNNTRDTWAIGKNNGKFLRVITANAAIDVLRADQRAGKFPKDDRQFTTWVDRDPRKSEQEVKFGGRIQYIQRQPLTEVYRWIWDELHKRSNKFKRKWPVTGRAAFRRRRYRQSHAMIVDGRTVINVGAGRVSPNFRTMERKFGLRHAKEVRFINIQPYARRIEHGSAYRPKYLKGRGSKPIRVRAGPNKGQTRNYLKLYWSAQAKGGVYQAVAKAAARRYKGIARIDYRRMQLPQTGYRFRHKGESIDQLYPIIRVRPDRGGKVDV